MPTKDSPKGLASLWPRTPHGKKHPRPRETREHDRWHPEDHEAIAAARADLAAEKLADWIERTLAEAPPLSEQQLSRIRAALPPAGDAGTPKAAPEAVKAAPAPVNDAAAVEHVFPRTQEEPTAGARRSSVPARAAPMPPEPKGDAAPRQGKRRS